MVKIRARIEDRYRLLSPVVEIEVPPGEENTPAAAQKVLDTLQTGDGDVSRGTDYQGWVVFLNDEDDPTISFPIYYHYYGRGWNLNSEDVDSKD